MALHKPPLLALSELTGRVYILTSYLQHADGRVEAKVKFDVTDQFDRIAAAIEQRRQVDARAQQ